LPKSLSQKVMTPALQRPRYFRSGKARVGCALSVIIAAATMVHVGPDFVQPDLVQQPLDRYVDLLLAPFWHAVQPVANLFSYLLLGGVRLHFRVEALRTPSATPTLASIANEAVDGACANLRRIFGRNFPAGGCPEALVVRGVAPRLAAFPLGLGHRWLLVLTEEAVRSLSGPELRFAVGHEIGRVLLRHTMQVPGWTVARVITDATAFPRYLLARLAPAGEHARATGHVLSHASGTVLGARLQLARAADSFLDACEVYRGLRTGRWPGLTDLDVGRSLRVWQNREDAAAMALGGSSPELLLLDTAVAVCAKIRSPGAPAALGAAALGTSAPWLAAWAFDLDRARARRLGRGLHLGAWTLGLWAAKLRSEVLSADRIGLLANGGDEDAAVRALIRTNHDRDASAMAALLGVHELKEQAFLLSRVLPRNQFRTEPNLPMRITELLAWGSSPQGETLLHLAAQA